MNINPMLRSISSLTHVIICVCKYPHISLFSFIMFLFILLYAPSQLIFCSECCLFYQVIYDYRRTIIIYVLITICLMLLGKKITMYRLFTLPVKHATKRCKIIIKGKLFFFIYCIEPRIHTYV